MLRISMLMISSLSQAAVVSGGRSGGQFGNGLHLALVAPLDHRLDHQRDQRQYRQQRGHGEGGHRLVFVVEHFHVQRHGVGLAADVTRHHRHRAELAHGARVAQDHAVQEAPLDVGQRHAPEGLPAGRAEHDGGLLLVGALRLHQRNELARDEREGHEHGGQHDAGHGEDDLDVVVGQPRADPALRAEHQHVDQARHHRRHRERQIDQRGEEGLAAELELGDGPGRSHAEHEVQRHRDGGRDQREADRAPGIGLLQRFEVRRDALAQRLGRHGRQRQHEEQEHERERNADQRPAHPGGFGGAGLCTANDLGRCAHVRLQTCDAATPAGR
jgi:hypothetical protein